MKRLGIGIYGCYAGHQVDQLLLDNPLAKIVAAYDVPRDRFKEAQFQGAQLYSDFNAFLHDENVDVISLCPPNRAKQVNIAITCMQQGKHVYAEKPSVLNRTDLKRLREFLSTSPKKYREQGAGCVYTGLFGAARKIVQSGGIGEPVQAFTQKSYGLINPVNPRPTINSLDGGLLGHVGIYNLRFVEGILGKKITSLQVHKTRIGNNDEASELHTAASMLMQLENGGNAIGLVNYLNPKGFPNWGNDQIRVYGTEGMLEITDGGRASHLYNNNIDAGALSPEPDLDYFFMFLDEVQGLKKIPHTIDDELRVLELLVEFL